MVTVLRVTSTSKPRDSNPVGPGTLPGRKVSPIQVNGDQGLGGYSLTGRRPLAGEPDVCEEAVIVPVELVPLFLVLGVDRNIIVAKPEPGILPGLMLNACPLDPSDAADAETKIDLAVPLI